MVYMNIVEELERCIDKKIAKIDPLHIQRINYMRRILMSTEINMEYMENKDIKYCSCHMYELSPEG